MAQVILTAPSHYLNQCWLVAGDIRWHPPESNFTKSAQAAFLYDESENGVNSLAPGKFEWNSKHEIFKQIDGWGISCDIALIWMSLGFTDDQSTLVQVMAWCRQATSHYLSQWWPRSMSPYGVTRPQWVKITATSSTSNISDFLLYLHNPIIINTAPSHYLDQHKLSLSIRAQGTNLKFETKYMKYKGLFQKTAVCPATIFMRVLQYPICVFLFFFVLFCFCFLLFGRLCVHPPVIIC